MVERNIERDGLDKIEWSVQLQQPLWPLERLDDDDDDDDDDGDIDDGSGGCAMMMVLGTMSTILMMLMMVVIMLVIMRMTMTVITGWRLVMILTLIFYFLRLGNVH